MCYSKKSDKYIYNINVLNEKNVKQYYELSKKICILWGNIDDLLSCIKKWNQLK